MRFVCFFCFLHPQPLRLFLCAFVGAFFASLSFSGAKILLFFDIYKKKVIKARFFSICAPGWCALMVEPQPMPSVAR